MERNTKGAWVIHHASKLSRVSGVSEFEKIDFAGKAGKLLSGLAGSKEETISLKTVDAMAKTIGISTVSELPSLLETLENFALVDCSKSSIHTLGLSTSGVLEHTADIFDSKGPSKIECATLEMAEKVSIEPTDGELLKEYLSDSYELKKDDVNDTLRLSEDCHFVDNEGSEDGSKLYFNGNLFRVENKKKIDSVLGSISSAEAARIGEVNEKLKSCGCLLKSDVIKSLGESTFAKLAAIGVYDISEVSNNIERVEFVTSPSAFNKFGNSFVEDLFDYAKALVASLTYGIQKRSTGSGRITMVKALLNKLINGSPVGPATAIGADYKVLEHHRVVKVIPSGNGMYSMILLKREVGEIAMKIIEDGDASELSATLPTVSLTSYIGPEVSRGDIRRKQVEKSKRETGEILTAMRTGGNL